VSPPGNAAGTSDWLIKLLGLAITIAAAAMGATFWFDALNRLVNLRNTGKIPESKT
jgi:putative Mn2+ efflux pump MntP